MQEMSSIIVGFTLEAAQGPQTGAAMVQAITTGRVPMQVEALPELFHVRLSSCRTCATASSKNGTCGHLAYLREKLTTSLVGLYNWTDTRDMAADGLTKGSVDRTMLARKDVMMNEHHYE